MDENNEQVGVLETRAAISMARDRGLDLILVAAAATPPVCRIMDYGKYKYEKSKRDKQTQQKSAAQDLKSVRLHPRTGEHDRNIRIRDAEKFLRAGHKVRVVCQFKGRENAYPQLGREQMDAVFEALKEFCTVEGPINKQGRDMTMNLAPKPGLKPKPKEDKNKIDGEEDDQTEEDEIEDGDEVDDDDEEFDDIGEDDDEGDGEDDEEDDDDEDDDDDDIEDEDAETKADEVKE